MQIGKGIWVFISKMMELINDWMEVMNISESMSTINTWTFGLVHLVMNQTKILQILKLLKLCLSGHWEKILLRIKERKKTGQKNQSALLTCGMTHMNMLDWIEETPFLLWMMLSFLTKKDQGFYMANYHLFQFIDKKCFGHVFNRWVFGIDHLYCGGGFCPYRCW